MAHWAFKLCIAGGIELPAFALADDGFVFCHQGEVYCGSDWMPKEAAIANLSCPELLVVPYPMATVEYTTQVVDTPAGRFTSIETKEQRDFALPGDRGKPMKTCFEAVLFTAIQKMGKAIALYRVGGLIGLLLGAVASMTAFSAAGLKRRLNKS